MTDNELNGRLTELFERLEKIEKRKSSAWVWDIAMKVTVAAMVGLFAWVFAQEQRMTRMETREFSQEHGRNLEDKLRKELPPQWLREDLEEMKNLLRSQDARLRQIEMKVK